MPFHRLSSLALIGAALLATPALAQTGTATSGSAPPGAVPNAAPQTTPPNAASSSTSTSSGSLQMAHGNWCAAQLVGATVYNDKDVSIGTIDNLLINHSGKVDQAVLSVGGFLGIGSKYVEVPFNRLRFETGQQLKATSSTPGSNGTSMKMPPSIGTSSQPVSYNVVLPGATRESLTSMQGFTY